MRARYHKPLKYWRNTGRFLFPVGHWLESLVFLALLSSLSWARPTTRNPSHSSPTRLLAVSSCCLCLAASNLLSSFSTAMELAAAAMRHAMAGRAVRNGHRLPSFRPTPLLLVLLVFFSTWVAAYCECGYSTTVGDETDPFVFTDLIESNFAQIQDIAQHTDWVRQEFNLSEERARGDFGELFAPDNVASVDPSSSPGGGGLALTVRSQLVDDMVPGAEIDTKRLDVFWGTFRASMKLSGSPGTCAAFFWVGHDVVLSSHWFQLALVRGLGRQR